MILDLPLLISVQVLSDHEQARGNNCSVIDLADEGDEIRYEIKGKDDADMVEKRPMIPLSASVIIGPSSYIPRVLKQGVNKWRYGRTFCQDNQGAQENE